MIINILAVGSIKESCYRDKISWYFEKINKKNKINIIEVKDLPIQKAAGERIINKIKLDEGERLLSHIGKNDYVVVLAIDGSTREKNPFDVIFSRAADKMCDTVTFVIGGSLGLGDNVIKRADYRLSFSPMTFPHQLMRVMLIERICADIYDM